MSKKPVTFSEIYSSVKLGLTEDDYVLKESDLMKAFKKADRTIRNYNGWNFYPTAFDFLWGFELFGFKIVLLRRRK